MARFSKTEMKKLCDYVGCDSNGKADEMKFNVLLKIYTDEEKTEDPDDDDEEKAKTKPYFIEVDINGKDNEWFNIEGDQSIDNVKDMIQSKIGIPPEDQRIVFKGKTVYEGTVEQLVADAGEIETVRVKFTCELQGGGKILILSWKSCSINLSFFM